MSINNRKNLRREKAIRQKRQKNIFNISIIVVGVLLLAVVLISNKKINPAKAFLEFTEADIYYGPQLQAVHEMNGPTLNQISFLPKDLPQPQLAVSETFYDFGKIGATDVVQHHFYLQNLGESPLTISRAYTTCGCTTADFSSTIIPPGKVIMMTLTFDAGYHDAGGQTVRRGVFIENNDPNHPELEIWTQANVLNN